MSARRIPHGQAVAHAGQLEAQHAGDAADAVVAHPHARAEIAELLAGREQQAHAHAAGSRAIQRSSSVSKTATEAALSLAPGLPGTASW